MIAPLGRHIVAELIPEAPQSTLILTPESPGLIQWAQIVSVGPKVTDLSAGQRVLLSSAQGHVFGSQLLIPSSSVLLISKT